MSDQTRSIFETASRNKVRIQTSKGLLSVEDLWDLPLSSTRGAANLDAIAQEFYKKVNDASPVSFVGSAAPSATRKADSLVFDIVKHVIDVKMAENAAAAAIADRKAQKAKVLEILANREEKALDGKTDEELRKMIEDI